MKSNFSNVSSFSSEDFYAGKNQEFTSKTMVDMNEDDWVGNGGRRAKHRKSEKGMWEIVVNSQQLSTKVNSQR